MTFKEILSDIINIAPSDFFHDNMYDPEYYPDVTKMIASLQENCIEYKVVDSYGGEGDGERYYRIYSFTKDNETLYVKFDGWYASYVGAEYSEWFFVEPYEKMVIDYRKVD